MLVLKLSGGNDSICWGVTSGCSPLFPLGKNGWAGANRLKKARPKVAQTNFLDTGVRDQRKKSTPASHGVMYSTSENL